MALGSPLVVKSGDLSAGNHALRRGRNFPRTSGAKRDGNREGPSGFEHRHYVVDADAFNKPEAGRCDIDGALRVVERIGLVRAAGGKFPRQCHGVFAVRKLVAYPSPIHLGIAMLSGLFPWYRAVLEEHGIDPANIQPEVAESPDEIARIFDRDSMGRAILAI